MMVRVDHGGVCAAVLAAVLTLAGSATLAAGQQPASVRMNGVTMLVGPAIRPFTPPATREPGPIRLFDNLLPARKYPDGTYFCCLATAIAGPANGYDPEQWWAEAFTPGVSATVTRIEVGVTYMEGTNSINIGLYTDAGGVPGTPLVSGDVSNLPPFGGCCATMSLKDKQGIAVTAGTQYWVVLSTDSNDTNFVGAWNYNTSDEVTKINEAINTGSGWQAGSYYPGVSLAV